MEKLTSLFVLDQSRLFHQTSVLYFHYIILLRQRGFLSWHFCLSLQFLHLSCRPSSIFIAVIQSQFLKHPQGSYCRALQGKLDCNRGIKTLLPLSVRDGWRLQFTFGIKCMVYFTHLIGTERPSSGPGVSLGLTQITSLGAFISPRDMVHGRPGRPAHAAVGAPASQLRGTSSPSHLAIDSETGRR